MRTPAYQAGVFDSQVLLFRSGLDFILGSFRCLGTLFDELQRRLSILDFLDRLDIATFMVTGDDVFATR